MQQLMGDLTHFDDNKLHEFHEHISYQITENFLKQKNLTRPFHFKISAIEKTPAGFIILEDIILSQEIRS